MSKLATAIKDEIQRLARKEIRVQIGGSKKLAARHRRDIAALKRQVRDLAREVTYLRRQAGERVKNATSADGAAIRFSPAWVAAHREKLALSAADYADLVGVSALTIYNWEKGKTKPQARQLAAWAKVRGIGKREALRRLEVLGA